MSELVVPVAKAIDPFAWAQERGMQRRRTDSLQQAERVLSVLAGWLDGQRTDVPAHGWEFAEVLRGSKP